MTVPRSGALRSCAAISGSVLAFAFLIDRAGLIPATAVATFVASAGARTFDVRKALILSIVAAAGMAVVFVGLLNQSFTLLAGL
jgi:hypothetical protein